MWSIPTLTDLSSLTPSLHIVLWFLPSSSILSQKLQISWPGILPQAGDGSRDVLHQQDVWLPGHQGHQSSRLPLLGAKNRNC